MMAWRQHTAPDDTEDMAGNDSDSSEQTDEGCIFCLIASDRDPDAEVLKKIFHVITTRKQLQNTSVYKIPENEELVCFKDIYPAAPHHYLVVPRTHIVNCESLHRGHIGLVERMAHLGREVLRDQGVTDMNDVRLGFHKPPYTSVDHLHLHVLAPGSQIPSTVLYKFIPGSIRFITESCLRKDLENVSQPQLCFLNCFPVQKRTSSS